MKTFTVFTIGYYAKNKRKGRFCSVNSLSIFIIFIPFRNIYQLREVNGFSIKNILQHFLILRKSFVRIGLEVNPDFTQRRDFGFMKTEITLFESSELRHMIGFCLRNLFQITIKAQVKLYPVSIEKREV